MRFSLLFLFYFLIGNVFGQVTGVDYVMKYNCETNRYDVYIEVLDGSATTILQRAQFNSQISLVVPTGETVVLHESYLPLQNNQFYDGTTPANWVAGNNPVIAPSAQPENDFYGITPTLTPTAFYNDLVTGDLVRIFSFTAGETEQYDENVRFFRNNEDPGTNAPGMGGKSFANGFTLGGAIQLYEGNREESCITSIDNVLESAMKIYPNPFQDQFIMEIPEEASDIIITDVKGELYYSAKIQYNRFHVINSSDFPSGVYFVKYSDVNGNYYNDKIIKP
ncbi:MAG: T9SS type A sorting domain-containing protein [Bacteroidota bacterium]